MQKETWPLTRSQVHAHHKPQREFNQLFLAQELHASPVVSTDAEEGKVPIATASDSTLSLILKNKSGAIWAMKFSRDGRYLAAAGTDKVVRVWQVLGSKEDRATHEQREDSASTNGVDRGGSGVRLNAPVFMSEPIHVYQGHTGDVLDLSWSKVETSDFRCIEALLIQWIEQLSPLVVDGQDC